MEFFIFEKGCHILLTSFLLSETYFSKADCSPFIYIVIFKTVAVVLRRIVLIEKPIKLDGFAIDYAEIEAIVLIKTLNYILVDC